MSSFVLKPYEAESLVDSFLMKWVVKMMQA